MLSLDIGGAFPCLSHERLLWVLRTKGYPPWVLRFITAFLQGRRTRLSFCGFESDWFPMETGIPQGSPLSPILFLLFIAELLEELQQPNSGSFGFGFVDDTNLVAWGNSAQDNCRRLETMHDRCIAWAKRYGAKFAPNKYHLIHFTKRKRDPNGDLASAVQINPYQIKPEATLRVLGVWVDPRLNWKEHTRIAANKGLAASDALSRIVSST
jgi:hypothetical protein